MTRGVLWMVWGDNPRVRAALPRSVESLRHHHPDLPYTVAEMPDDGDLRCKSLMSDRSPYDLTMYLDADTVVMGDLSFAFDQAKRHGIACCVNVCPWARRYAGLQDRGDIVEYDTGVLAFYGRHPAVADVFSAWKSYGDIDSNSYFTAADGIARMPVNDQCGFAAAVHDLGACPFVLPVNWNFHPRWQKTFFGPIRVWHDYNDPNPGVLAWNQRYTGPGGFVIDCGQIA